MPEGRDNRRDGSGGHDTENLLRSHPYGDGTAGSGCLWMHGRCAGRAAICTHTDCFAISRTHADRCTVTHPPSPGAAEDVLAHAVGLAIA